VTVVVVVVVVAAAAAAAAAAAEYLYGAIKTKVPMRSCATMRYV